MTDLFLATVNVPGYLPMSDERHVFHDAASAWQYLVAERMRGEDNADDDESCEYSDTVNLMEDLAIIGCMRGAVHGATPGSDSEHDLGLTYSVTVWEHARYPHEAGRLDSCAACEYTCHCDPSGEFTECVHCGLVSDEESSCEDGECDAKGH